MSKKRRLRNNEQRAINNEQWVTNDGQPAEIDALQAARDKQPIARSTFARLNVFWHSVINIRYSGLLLAVLMVMCLSLTAQHPLMFGSLTRTDDALQHLYRLVALDSSIRHADLWPRYVPTLVYGYGIPLFNFYSPLSLYPLELLHLLGMRFLNALLVGMMLYTLVGALGAFLLGKRWAGTLGGIGTAVAYAYAPYSLFNLYQRGAVGEVAGLALLPWVLWAFDRLAAHGRQRDFALAVLFFSLLILVHNITALYGTFLLIPYCLLLWWTGKNPPQIFGHLLLAGVMSVGLATFFWLPALAESHYVQLYRMNIGVAAEPDTQAFYSVFQTLGETLAFPESADLTRFNQPSQRTLGWPQILLSLLGLILTYWRYPRNKQRHKEPRGKIITALIIVAILVFTTTKLSAWLWTIIPFAHRFQFPWRGLGPASLLLALTAGVGMALLAKRMPWQIGQAVWTTVCVFVMVLYSVPWLYRLYIPNPPADSVVDAQDYERKTGQIGGTAMGDYLPRWVTELPDPQRLIGLYAQGEVIPRLQPLPGVVTVEQADWGMNNARLTLTAKEATTLTLDWLYFPGWWAELDGEAVSIFPTEPSGLLGINVPAGKHDLEIGFGPTLLRLTAMIVSGIFFLILPAILVFVKPLWQHPSRHSFELAPHSETVSTLSIKIIFSVAVLGVLLFLGKVLLIDDFQTPFKSARFANSVETGLQFPVRASFEGQIDLLGYDLASSQLASGQIAHLTLYWQPAHEDIAGDYSSVIFLRDPAGTVVAQTGSIYPGGWATHDWLPGFYVLEKLNLTIPRGTPPGEYTLDASLFWHAENRSLNTFDQQGNPLGITVSIGKLAIVRPARAAHQGEMGIGLDQSLSLLNAPLSDSIRLLAANRPPEAAGVGQLFILIVDWQARAQPTKPYAFRLLWLDDKGEVSAATPSTPLVVNFSSDKWKSGDLWKGIHPLYVPGRLEAGDYTVAIQLFTEEEEAVGERVEMGQMTVSTPERTFQSPDMEVTADISWGNGVRLLGYDLPDQTVRQSDGLSLTLYWQTKTDITTNLTVFVHIYDADGRTAAQQDSIPLGGARPTTSWAPGEVLTDRYAIFIPPSIPPDRYWVRIGLYNATSGARTYLSDGSEFWVLPQSIHITDR